MKPECGQGTRFPTAFSTGRMRLWGFLVLSAVLAASGPGEAKEVEFRLFFPIVGPALLGVEARLIEDGPTRADKIKNVVLALAQGPRTDLAPVFFDGLSLRQVFLDRNGLVYVDLEVDRTRTLAVGVEQERLIIWSLVNTVCLNFKEVKGVKILVNGDEGDTLLGHIDLSRPFYPDLSLVKTNDSR